MLSVASPVKVRIRRAITLFIILILHGPLEGSITSAVELFALSFRILCTLMSPQASKEVQTATLS